jgi:hypothetical protein
MNDDFLDADEPFIVENPGWKHKAMSESFSMTIGHRQCRYLDFFKDNQITLPGNYSQHHIVYIPNRNVSFSSISRDHISLQATCQIVVDRSAWLGQPICCSLVSDVQIHFVCLMSHAAVMLLIFVTFCVLTSLVNYGRSKRVMKVGSFDRRWASCDEP